MVTKKTKKSISKKPKKAIVKPKIAKKAAKLVKTFEQKVIEKMEEEVKKPVLGKEVIPKPFGEKRFEQRFIPGKKFIPKHRFKRKEFAQPEFKSAGEMKIANFLRDEHIHYLYEYPLTITDEDRKIRIWYPDFWLPELNIMIEYMGMKGQIGYDRQMVRKKKIYNALKIDFIEITPGLILKGNWKRFIAMKIMDIMKSKNYLFNKMKALAQKYRVPAEEKNIDLTVLDE